MIDEEEEDLALLSSTSSLAVTSPPLVDRMRVADLPLFLKELKIARRLAISSPIFTSDSEEKRVCEELTTGSRRTFNFCDQLKVLKQNQWHLHSVGSL